MTITLAGMAILTLAFLIMRGGTGRIGIIVAAMCGSAVALIGQFASTAWGVGETVLQVANSLGG